MTDYDALRALALAATPGPWKAEFNRNMHGRVNMYWLHGSASLGVQHDPDAAYIAAIDPGTLLALMDERDAALARAERVEALLREARAALSGGLWDYGPGQDEHERCNEVIARLDAALAGQAGNSFSDARDGVVAQTEPK